MQRIKEAADRCTIIINDINMRIGSRIIQGTRIEDTMHDWPLELEKAYHFASVAAVHPSLFPIYTSGSTLL